MFFSLFSVNIILSSRNIDFSGKMRYKECHVTREKRQKRIIDFVLFYLL